MIVEVIGPPGVGKTTIVRRLDGAAAGTDLPLLGHEATQALDRELGEAAIMKKKRFRRWRILAPLLFQRPVLVAQLVLLTVAHGRPFLRRSRKAQRVLARVLFDERLALRCPDSIVVHDDGFLQCLWSMLIDSKRLRCRRVVRSVIHTYYSNTDIARIHLEIDDAATAERVFARASKGRFNRDSSPERRAQFGQWLDYHRELRAALPDSGSTPRIDARGDVDDVAKQVLDAIHALRLPG